MTLYKHIYSPSYPPFGHLVFYLHIFGHPLFQLHKSIHLHVHLSGHLAFHFHNFWPPSVSPVQICSPSCPPFWAPSVSPAHLGPPSVSPLVLLPPVWAPHLLFHLHTSDLPPHFGAPSDSRFVSLHPFWTTSVSAVVPTPPLGTTLASPLDNFKCCKFCFAPACFYMWEMAFWGTVLRQSFVCGGPP